MKTLLVVPLALAVSGCMAEQGAFPSLAPRPVEAIDPRTEPPAPPVVPVAADPLQAQFAAEQTAVAEDGERAFRAELAENAPIVRAARGQASGSERSIEAQVALSRLQASRSAVADALRAIDERRATVADPALDAAFTRISALDAGQAAEVATLAALLGV